MSQRKNPSVLLFFIDGLGIGYADENNPFLQIENLEPLAHFKDSPLYETLGGVLIHTDPRLGVEGRPQSASGQTTILTGINAPKALSYHKQGFPNERLRGILYEFSIFKQLKQLGVDDGVFANAYTPAFFSEKPRWKSATTCAVEAAGMQFRKLPDLIGGKALFHDFTNRSLIERGFDVSQFTPVGAAQILSELAAKHSFVLYEHFLTDKIGHDQDWEKARMHLPLFAEFVRQTVANVDPGNTTVILTSDHGNIEDLSVRNHTLNDVPTIVWGRRREETAKRIKDLTDITPAIIKLLTE